MNSEENVLNIRDCQYRKPSYMEVEAVVASLGSKPKKMKTKTFNALKAGDFMVVDAKCSSVDGKIAYFETEFQEVACGKLKELGTGNFQINAGTVVRFINVNGAICVYLMES